MPNLGHWLHLVLHKSAASLSLVAHPSYDLRDPYSDETPSAAFLSLASLGDRIRGRRPELKLTAKEVPKS